jgi:hypothetical protein
MNFLGTKMIKITVENVEGMEPGALHRIAGLFTVIANYAGGITAVAVATPVVSGDRFASDIAKDYATHEKGATPFNPFAGASLPGSEAPAPSLAELDPAHVPTANAWPDFKAVANMTPSVPPVPQAAGIDVDSKGSPWDGRIHASTRAKVADGTWRMKRGADEALIASVQGEIAQTMGLPVIVPPAPFVVSAVPPVPQTNISPIMASAGAAQIASPSNFLALMKGITAGYADKSITQENINSACAGVGVPSLPMLSQRPDLIGKVALVLGVVLQ